MKKQFKNLIIDVDGVMTDGKFYYTNSGKVMKAFGADDHDALSILKHYIKIFFVTGDKKGFSISKKRIVKDMGFKLNLVSTIKRVEWIRERFNLKETIYIGDGIMDYLVMNKIGYSITPRNANNFTKKFASHILKRPGGDRAVAEAALFILSRFFSVKNFSKINLKNKKMSGNWQI
jgi:3-deoxy-D-manno-octulosonate 8-phosphate phosphatase (KDO 8-P phosphatase)